MRTIAIARRIVLQVLGDRRTLAMILVAPLLVLGLLSLIFTGKDYQPRIAVVDAPPPFATRLAERGGRVTELAGDEADRRLNAGAIDAIFRVEAGRPHLVVDGGDPTVTRATLDRKSTRLNSSHGKLSRMPSSA